MMFPAVGSFTGTDGLEIQAGNGDRNDQERKYIFLLQTKSTIVLLDNMERKKWTITKKTLRDFT